MEAAAVCTESIHLHRHCRALHPRPVTTHTSRVHSLLMPPACMQAGNIAFLAHDVALHHFVLLTGFDT